MEQRDCKRHRRRRHVQDGGGVEVVAEKAEQAADERRDGDRREVSFVTTISPMPPAELRLAIKPKVVTKNRVQIRVGITSLRRTLLAEASCLKAECVLDRELAVQDAALIADAAFVW